MPLVLDKLPAIQAMRRSAANGRFPHAVLIQGQGLDPLEAACGILAADLLASEQPQQHPDFHALRPADRMRRIGVDHVRDLTRSLSRSSNRGGAKCACIFEADRMSPQAANAFLKTLEEPPAETYLFLLSERPYDLLPTIRSRCLNLRIPDSPATATTVGWDRWLQDYSTWMRSVATQKPGRPALADWTLGLYGLICRYDHVLANGRKAALEQHPDYANEALTKEEREAIEVLVKKRVRDRLWTGIEAATRDFCLVESHAVKTGELIQLIAPLEHVAGLLEANFQDTAALETFLLQSMRIWAASPRS